MGIDYTITFYILPNRSQKKLFSVCHKFVFVYEKNVSFWRESKSTRPHLNGLQKRSTTVLCHTPEKPTIVAYDRGTRTLSVSTNC